MDININRAIFTKTKMMRFLVFISIFIFCSACSEKKANKEVEFKVRGNCSMCQNRIEEATNSIKGIKKAEWNVDTEILKVSFDSNSTSEIEIHRAVAAKGHGTDKVEMNQTEHANLPDCCKVGGDH